MDRRVKEIPVFHPEVTRPNHTDLNKAEQIKINNYFISTMNGKGGREENE